MPFSNSGYIKGFGIIGMDLTPTEDGNLHVLPSLLTGNLKVEMQFRQNYQDVVILYTEEF